MNRGEYPAEQSFTTLLSGVTEKAGELIHAELDLFRAHALKRVAAAQTALALIVSAAILAHAALICLFVMLGIALAKFVGPLGAGLAVLLLTAIVCYVLIRLGIRKLTADSGTSGESTLPPAEPAR